MEEFFKTDIIDGKVINWDKLSIEELNVMRADAEQKEQNIVSELISIFNNFIEE